MTGRMPFPGRSHLVSIESVQDKPLAVYVARFSAASELAQALAKEFEGAIKASLVEIKGTAETEHREGQPSPEGEKPRAEFVFTCDGDKRFISAFGKEGQFQNRVGSECLAILIANLGKPILMVELIEKARGEPMDTTRMGPAPNPQPIWDEEAHRDIRAQLVELTGEIKAAEKRKDFTQTEIYRNEFHRSREQVKRRLHQRASHGTSARV